MFATLRGPVAVLGRVLLAAIFLMSAVGNKIPHFGDVVKIMESVGMPVPTVMLIGAIGFLVVGSVLVILGFGTRIGAAMLLTFLVLASYYFHPFWTLQGQAQQEQMIQFMKNLSMMGAMIFLIANGAGPASVDGWLATRAQASSEAHAEHVAREKVLV
jgi:putative oxidoreductase